MNRALVAIWLAVSVSVTGTAAPGWAQAAGGSNLRSVPVTVFDTYSSPYTIQGYADQSGSVIVFDPGPGSGIASLDIPSSYIASPGISPFGGTPLNEVLETSAPPPVVAQAGVSMYPYGTASGSPQASPQAAPGAPPAAPVQGTQGTAAGEKFVDGIYVLNTDYLMSFPENIYRIVTGPLRYDRDDWINVALVVGITGSLVLLDEGLMDFWQNDLKGDFTKSMADAFRPLGDSNYIIYGSLGGYALAEVLGMKREKAAALSVLQSFALTGGLISGMKYVTGRKRPEESDDSFDFNGPAEADFNASFPSGHAGHAFAVASVISEMYGEDNPWVPWLAYPLATGTALARVDDNRHWFSDVFLAAALGHFIGKMVVEYSPFMERNNITLAPMSGDSVQGVSVSLRY